MCLFLRKIPVSVNNQSVLLYNRTLALNPDSTHTHVLKGISLAGIGRHEEAIMHYNRRLDIDPDDPQVLAKRGESLVALGRHG